MFKTKLIKKDKSKNKTYVGFCHNKKHRGFITPKIMIEHQCIPNNCPYFEINEEHPLFNNYSYKTNEINYSTLIRLKNRFFGKDYEEFIKINFKDILTRCSNLKNIALNIKNSINNIDDDNNNNIYNDSDSNEVKINTNKDILLICIFDMTYSIILIIKSFIYYLESINVITKDDYENIEDENILNLYDRHIKDKYYNINENILYLINNKNNINNLITNPRNLDQLLKINKNNKLYNLINENVCNDMYKCFDDLKSILEIEINKNNKND